MPYFVHASSLTDIYDIQELDTHYATREEAFRAKSDGQTVTFIPVGSEFNWTTREAERLENGTYLQVPWLYADWYCEYTRKFEGYSDLRNYRSFHYAHMSVSHPGLIAYTPDVEKGVQDRQLRVRPGKYLTTFAPQLSQSEVDDLVAQCKATEDRRIDWAISGADIERVYRTGPSSCMSHSADSYSSRGIHPVLWSCHTDTVHRESGSQRVFLNADGILTSNGTCLGADDTAGVFLLCELIRRKVPGRYYFHYGEELGCIGSRDIAADNPQALDGVRYAVALDRAGYGDIITHQMGQRTASTAFATGLATLLNASGLRYAPSDRGMYTDTESYAGLVAECTNLSVGYSAQHSARESLDTRHVLALLDALSAIDIATCASTRDPFAAEPTFAEYDRVTGDYVRYAVSVATGKRSVIHTPYRAYQRDIYLDAVYAEVQEDLQRRWDLELERKRKGNK